MICTALAVALSGCPTYLAEEVVTGPRGLGVVAAPAVEGDHLRFAAVGDMGRDEPEQRQLARRVHEACDQRCDFVMLLGDNLYEYGMDPDAVEHDTAKLQCLLDRYPATKYVTLGNHDYHPLFPDGTRGDLQVAWLGRSGDDYRGGFHFYRFEVGELAAFWALDTNYLVRGEVPWHQEPKLMKFGETIEADRAGWKIVFGHHPMLSNGYHGNAGGFLEGDFLDFWSGEAFREYLLEYVAGNAHLYIAGHEHNLQFFGRAFGSNTGYLVSGSGAKCTPRGANPRMDASSLLEHYGYGFSIVDVTPTKLEVRFYGYDGSELWGTWRGRRGGWFPIGDYDKRLVHLESRCDDERQALEAADEQAGGAECDLP